MILLNGKEKYKWVTGVCISAQDYRDKDGNLIEHYGFAQFAPLALNKHEIEGLSKLNSRPAQRVLNVAVDIVTKEKPELLERTKNLDFEKAESQFYKIDEINNVSIFDLENLAQEMENRSQVLKAAATRLKVCFDYHKHDCAKISKDKTKITAN